MAQVLQDKALATKFQILVEIAASQPNIRQKDIASKLSVSPQAISEYIEKLVKDALVISDGRSKYRVTTEGVNWVIKTLRELESYAAFVKKAVTNITICTAVADCNLSQGQEVTLEMMDGLLFATNVLGKGAKGRAVSDAKKGEDVGISNIEGIVELEAGKITVLRVPSIQRGGSKNVDLARLKKEINKGVLVGAIGIEALTTLRRIGTTPHYFYGVQEAMIECARSGLPFVVVCAEDDISSLLQRVAGDDLSYEVVDLDRRRVRH